MINLEGETEVEDEEQTGYSWTTYLGMMSAIGLASFATYKFTQNKSHAKTLFDDVVHEDKAKTSREKLVM